MKADNEFTEDNLVELNGTVVKKKFGKGSKSQRDATYLETNSGSYVIRRKGSNPFSDPELEKFIGKKVSAKGIIRDYLFLANDIKKI